jgi:hypothetical protein
MQFLGDRLVALALDAEEVPFIVVARIRRERR